MSDANERPTYLTLSDRIDRIEEILKSIEWSGVRVEEDWQPDGDGSRYYEGISICPACRGNKVDEMDREMVARGVKRLGERDGHSDWCKLGELCR